LYIAYYGSQRPGVSIHSPLHCLPGTGWEPIEDATVPIATGAVRRVTMQKNLDRVVVIYWYQMHGRAVASEIRSKAYGLFDRVRSGRSTAALVRIAVPITGDRDAAAARGLSFVDALLPQLAPVLL
jgi:EpsI family protein